MLTLRSQGAEKGENMFLGPDYKIAFYEWRREGSGTSQPLKGLVWKPHSLPKTAPALCLRKPPKEQVSEMSFPPHTAWAPHPWQHRGEQQWMSPWTRVSLGCTEVPTSSANCYWRQKAIRVVFTATYGSCRLSLVNSVKSTAKKMWICIGRLDSGDTNPVSKPS